MECGLFKERQKDIRSKMEKLKELQDREGPTVMKEIKKLQQDLFIMLAQEDLKWKQRAKRNWYKYGDRNTKYFHTCDNQRRVKNSMKKSCR